MTWHRRPSGQMGLGIVAALAAVSVSAVAAQPLSPGFTYQGYLLQGGLPADGSYHLRFRLWDAAAGGTPVAPFVNLPAVDVDAGRFTAELDFGISALDGDERFLEIEIVSPGPASVLTPRQELTPAPYAVYAMTSAWDGLLGIPVGFADGVDDVGALTLPFDGGATGNSEAVFALTQDGLGPVASFHATDGGNYYEGLFVSHAGTGTTIKGLKSPNTMGYVADFENLSTTNPFPAIRAKTNGTSAAVNADGGALGYGVTANTSGPGNAFQGTASGTGLAGKFTGSENNGTTAVMKIISGSQEMLLDGNEIDSSVALYLNYNNSNDVVLARGGGRVGIGRTSPLRLLHVGDANLPDSEGMIRLESRSGTNGSQRTWDIGVPETDSNSSGIGYSFVIDDTGSAGTDFMIKWGSGAVGIGTTDIPAGVRLAVDGKALFEEVEIQLSQDWPDYVFADDYPLMPLEEVAAAIQRDRHLPGMPPADTIAAQGLRLGDMQTRIVEKVEELTLYMIELDREVDTLRSDNARLRDELAALRATAQR